MRRYLLVIFLVVFSATVKSQITWDGGGDAVSWNDAANWVGNVVPGAADNVLLDNSVVGGSYTVNLPTGAVTVSVNSLSITPSGVNNITLVLPSGNTANPGFTATGAGDAVVLNNGAIFINSSGAGTGTSVTVTTSNFFRINNGGKYVHNTQRANTFTILNADILIILPLDCLQFLELKAGLLNSMCPVQAHIWFPPAIEFMGILFFLLPRPEALETIFPLESIS